MIICLDSIFYKDLFAYLKYAVLSGRVASFDVVLLGFNQSGLDV